VSRRATTATAPIAAPPIVADRRADLAPDRR
jgi:hypothetical protein